MRPPKDPQQRINEILDAAEFLFYTKGYERTTIQDIAKRMGVAQGAMYYYFKSKGKVLEGIMERKAKHILFVVHRVKEEPLQGYEKLSAIVSRILQEISSKEGAFLDLMYSDQVAPFTNRALEYMAVALTQELEEFIGDAASDKDIQVQQVDTVIYFLLEVINDLVDVLGEKLSPREVNARMRMGEKMLAAILDCDVKEIKIRLT